MEIARSSALPRCEGWTGSRTLMVVVTDFWVASPVPRPIRESVSSWWRLLRHILRDLPFRPALRRQDLGRSRGLGALWCDPSLSASGAYRISYVSLLLLIQVLSVSPHHSFLSEMWFVRWSRVMFRTLFSSSPWILISTLHTLEARTR